MKLNRVLSAFVLTGLFSVAAMAAQAQTRVMVRFGSPAAGVAVNYSQHAPGNGYTWVSGYYNGNEWMPGQWVYRVDSRYQQRDNRYNDRNTRYYSNDRRDNGNQYYGDNNNGYDNHYRQNDQNGRNSYHRNDRGNNNRNWNNNQRDNRGGRH